jgi:environmental stress-induced protein Ves
MAMTLYPAKDRSVSVWKNGKGTTREVVVFPRGADLENFGWRVSIAEIGQSGPFSNFPGIDRLLAVLEGKLVLRIDGAAATILVPGSGPVAFAGGVPCMADIEAGRLARDLNVMTRRGQFSSRMALVAADGPIPVLAEACATLLVALCDLTLGIEGSAIRLQPLDAVCFDESKDQFFCTSSGNRSGPGSLYVIQLFAEQPKPA